MVFWERGGCLIELPQIGWKYTCKVKVLVGDFLKLTML